MARSVVPVPSDFDARYSARWKRYAYYVCSDSGAGGSLPFAWSRHSWRVSKSLNYDLMVDAAAMISTGERNFEWMCVVQRGEMRDTRRSVTLTVDRVQPTALTSTATTTAEDEDDDGQPYFLRRNNGEDSTAVLYKIHCTCDFFLYKMMRRIVGVLIAVGGGDACLNDLKSCLDGYDNFYSQPNARKMMFKPTIPPKLLHTAPAKGLCLEHIKYDIVI